MALLQLNVSVESTWMNTHDTFIKYLVSHSLRFCFMSGEKSHTLASAVSLLKKEALRRYQERHSPCSTEDQGQIIGITCIYPMFTYVSHLV